MEVFVLKFERRVKHLDDRCGEKLSAFEIRVIEGVGASLRQLVRPYW